MVVIPDSGTDELVGLEGEFTIIIEGIRSLADSPTLLDIPFFSAHTPTDNLVVDFLARYFAEREPKLIEDVQKALLEIPEYRIAAQKGAGTFDEALAVAEVTQETLPPVSVEATIAGEPFVLAGLGQFDINLVPRDPPEASLR